MHNDHPEITLDLSGLLCPLPVLKARKKLNQTASGTVLIVIATDPMAAIDIPHFCNEQGHQLESQSTDGSILTFRIRRK
jgi:tRNA 2-thiouridine synthesizing protein A